MRKIKKTTNWVYVECAKCGKKRDISVKDYEKKLSNSKNEEELLNNILCNKCKKVSKITDNVIDTIEKIINIDDIKENISEEPVYEVEDKLYSK